MMRIVREVGLVRKCFENIILYLLQNRSYKYIFVKFSSHYCLFIMGVEIVINHIQLNKDANSKTTLLKLLNLELKNRNMDFLTMIDILIVFYSIKKVCLAFKVHTILSVHYKQSKWKYLGTT